TPDDGARPALARAKFGEEGDHPFFARAFRSQGLGREILFALGVVKEEPAHGREQRIVVMIGERDSARIGGSRRGVERQVRFVVLILAQIYVPVALRRDEGEEGARMPANAGNRFGIKPGKDLFLETAVVDTGRMRFVENLDTEDALV